jgi:Domain of unknown function (DUF4259)
MGTWGSDSFENDYALDWIAGFCDAPCNELVLSALSRVAEMDFFDDLKAPECSVGIAAAEVVAALKGVPSPNLPAEANECASASLPGAIRRYSRSLSPAGTLRP